MNIFSLLAVFLGGGVGSLCRFIVDSQIKNCLHLPLSTFLINTAGSFLLGFFTYLLTNGTFLSYLLATGFCGGFTTFSTATVEIVKEMRGRRPAWAVFLSLGQIIFACCATWVGMILAHSVL